MSDHVALRYDELAKVRYTSRIGACVVTFNKIIESNLAFIFEYDSYRVIFKMVVGCTTLLAST